MRNVIAAVLVLVVIGSTASGQQPWAEKMFKEGLTHDFGVVPHGAQLFHRFTITNIYAVRMEVIGVNSGCSCVTATAPKRVLEPRETATIDVSMDARRFTGAKTVGIRVTVGPEFTSSAELRVSATSRQDIVFNPGEVNFGQVTQGQKLVQKVDVEYAGRLDWQLKEVAIAKDLPVDVVTTEKYRRPGQVGYTLEVTLRPDAPTGILKDFIHLKTNDPNAAMVPLLIEAKVAAALTVLPREIKLGIVKANDPLIRRVVVQANKPFRVLEVVGLDNNVTLDNTQNTTVAPVQTLTFRLLFDKPGEFKRELKIKTDAQDAPGLVTIEATVQP